MRKTEKIKLFGISIELSERNASDVFALEKLYNESIVEDNDKLQYLYIEFGIRRILDSLKYGYKKLSLLNKLRLNYKLSVTYFINNLSLIEIKDYIDIIDKLEGVEVKKKDQATEDQSAE